jgi:hypothetical protein
MAASVPTLLPVALACPNGIPYQPHVRSNVIALHKSGLSNAAISQTSLDRPCKRTVQEWVQRYKRDPEHRVPEPLSLLGGVPMSPQEAAYCLWVIKCAMPALSAVVAQPFITLAYKILPSAAKISREVKRRDALGQLPSWQSMPGRCWDARRNSCEFGHG